MDYLDVYSPSTASTATTAVTSESTECLNSDGTANAGNDFSSSFALLTNVPTTHANHSCSDGLFSELDFETSCQRERIYDGEEPGPSNDVSYGESDSDDYYRFYCENSDDHFDEVIKQLEDQIAKVDTDISTREKTIMDKAKDLINKAEESEQERSLLIRQKRELKQKQVLLHNALRERKLFCCFICGRSFLSEELVRQHISTVHLKDNKSFKFDCPKCYMKFKMFHHLQRHLKTHVTNGVREFSCSYCSAVYKESLNLEIHLSSVHSKTIDGSDLKKAYQCQCCSESFGIEAEFKRHSYYCERKEEISLKRKETKKNLVTLGSVSFSPAMTISSCLSSPAFSTTSEGSLGRPIKDKSCPYCNEVFASMQSRNRHIGRKHPDMTNDSRTTEYKYLNTGSPDLSFGCSECGKTFASHASLSTHRKRIHTKELRYVCDQCGKRYPLQSELKKHERVHQNGKALKLEAVNEYYNVEF